VIRAMCVETQNNVGVPVLLTRISDIGAQSIWPHLHPAPPRNPNRGSALFGIASCLSGSAVAPPAAPCDWNHRGHFRETQANEGTNFHAFAFWARIKAASMEAARLMFCAPRTLLDTMPMIRPMSSKTGPPELP
jgi:hypothetical protein